MTKYENLQISSYAEEIIERDLKDKNEKELVSTILNNYHQRGLICNQTDEVIAVTELIVLTNCLRNTNEKEGSS